MSSSPEPDKAPILNLAGLECRPWGHGEGFEARIGYIGRRLGAQKLGYNLTIVAPGKRAFPLHNHRANEELFIILSGEGLIRIGASRYPIKSWDVIACPPGGPETAHQIVNTSATEELRYLAISTMLGPEVAEYPDSGKFAVVADGPAGPDGKKALFSFVGRRDQALDYWEGE